MQHKCRVTVLDKKLYPELQRLYCADRDPGVCPCYNVGDEYVFERYAGRDDFWHMGTGTLIKGSGDVAGSDGVPHCSEAWDAISRYIYSALQGGSIMRGWMNDERVMIACCSDGTRPVIFKIERIDYKALHVKGIEGKALVKLENALMEIGGVTGVTYRGGFIEIYVERDVPDSEVISAVEAAGGTVERID